MISYSENPGESFLQTDWEEQDTMEEKRVMDKASIHVKTEQGVSNCQNIYVMIWIARERGIILLIHSDT